MAHRAALLKHIILVQEANTKTAALAMQRILEMPQVCKQIRTV